MKGAYKEEVIFWWRLVLKNSGCKYDDVRSVLNPTLRADLIIFFQTEETGMCERGMGLWMVAAPKDQPALFLSSAEKTNMLTPGDHHHSVTTDTSLACTHKRNNSRGRAYIKKDVFATGHFLNSCT